ncbi:protein phosphatase 2C domain-containing protein [Bradyrhizobium sp. CCBAU 11357]|uniref:protein phosphatase 2C domain-containing protein n=1 Tax=Bradyrhizobium sp. CCBAU 11357 TaxID=1630808 RepID=UPI003FA43D9A
MIRSQRAFRLAKEYGRPCEDFVAGWRKEGRYAVSDGASESFDSAGWAKILCRHYLRDINFGSDWIVGARHRYNAGRKVDLDDWSAQHASERGSSATLLGLTISPTNIVAHGVGDTTMFICNGSQNFTTFPAEPSGGYGNSPELLCSDSAQSRISETDDFFLRHTLVHPAPAIGWYGTTLIVVTDSLAAWIVEGPVEDRWLRLNELCAVRDRDAFQALCVGAMERRSLRKDDFALLVIEL